MSKPNPNMDNTHTNDPSDTRSSLFNPWRSAQHLSWAGLAATLGIAAYFIYVNRAFYHDDAYISLRYVRQFLDGHGLVWNTGEYVQGYTNFLFVMLVALLGKLGIDLVVATRILSSLSLLGLIWLFWTQTTRIGGPENNHPLRVLPLILLLSASPLWLWTLGGLETIFLALLISIGFIAFLYALDATARTETYLFISGIAFTLAVLTRPDSGIFLATSGLTLLLNRPTRRWRTLLFFSLPSVLVLTPYLLWTWSYYGELVPNTFYAKADSITLTKLYMGSKYIGLYLLSPPFLTLAAMAALVWAYNKKYLDLRLIYLTLSGVLFGLYILSIGGDHMQSYRMLVPVIPISVLIISLIVPRIEPLQNTAAAAWVIVAVLLLASTQVTNKRLSPIYADPAAHYGSIIGKFIEQNWPAGSLVALNTAGSTPYYGYSHRYIDMLGLNDSVIAKRPAQKPILSWMRIPGHSKGDGDYVLSRQPDFIIIGPAIGSKISDPWFLSDLELKENPAFSEQYELVTELVNSQSERVEMNHGPIMEKCIMGRNDRILFNYYRRRESSSE